MSYNLKKYGCLTDTRKIINPNAKKIQVSIKNNMLYYVILCKITETGRVNKTCISISPGDIKRFWCWTDDIFMIIRNKPDGCIGTANFTQDSIFEAPNKRRANEIVYNISNFTSTDTFPISLKSYIQDDVIDAAILAEENIKSGLHFPATHNRKNWEKVSWSSDGTKTVSNSTNISFRVFNKTPYKINIIQSEQRNNYPYRLLNYEYNHSFKMEYYGTEPNNSYPRNNAIGSIPANSELIITDDLGIILFRAYGSEIYKNPKTVYTDRRGKSYEVYDINVELPVFYNRNSTDYHNDYLQGTSACSANEKYKYNPNARLIPIWFNFSKTWVDNKTVFKLSIIGGHGYKTVDINLNEAGAVNYSSVLHFYTDYTLSTVQSKKYAIVIRTDELLQVDNLSSRENGCAGRFYFTKPNNPNTAYSPEMFLTSTELSSSFNEGVSSCSKSVYPGLYDTTGKSLVLKKIYNNSSRPIYYYKIDEKGFPIESSYSSDGTYYYKINPLNAADIDINFNVNTVFKVFNADFICIGTYLAANITNSQLTINDPYDKYPRDIDLKHIGKEACNYTYFNKKIRYLNYIKNYLMKSSIPINSTYGVNFIHNLIFNDTGIEIMYSLYPSIDGNEIQTDEIYSDQIHKPITFWPKYPILVPSGSFLLKITDKNKKCLGNIHINDTTNPLLLSKYANITKVSFPNYANTNLDIKKLHFVNLDNLQSTNIYKSNSTSTQFNSDIMKKMVQNISENNYVSQYYMLNNDFPIISKYDTDVDKFASMNLVFDLSPELKNSTLIKNENIALMGAEIPKSYDDRNEYALTNRRLINSIAPNYNTGYGINGNADFGFIGVHSIKDKYPLLGKYACNIKIPYKLFLFSESRLKNKSFSSTWLPDYYKYVQNVPSGYMDNKGLIIYRDNVNTVIDIIKNTILYELSKIKNSGKALSEYGELILNNPLEMNALLAKLKRFDSENLYKLQISENFHKVIKLYLYQIKLQITFAPIINVAILNDLEKTITVHPIDLLGNVDSIASYTINPGEYWNITTRFDRLWQINENGSCIAKFISNSGGSFASCVEYGEPYHYFNGLKGCPIGQTPISKGLSKYINIRLYNDTGVDYYITQKISRTELSQYNKNILLERGKIWNGEKKLPYQSYLPPYFRTDDLFIITSAPIEHSDLSLLNTSLDDTIKYGALYDSSIDSDLQYTNKKPSNILLSSNILQKCVATCSFDNNYANLSEIIGIIPIKPNARGFYEGPQACSIIQNSYPIDIKFDRYHNMIKGTPFSSQKINLQNNTGHYIKIYRLPRINSYKKEKEYLGLMVPGTDKLLRPNPGLTPQYYHGDIYELRDINGNCVGIVSGTNNLAENEHLGSLRYISDFTNFPASSINDFTLTCNSIEWSGKFGKRDKGKTSMEIVNNLNKPVFVRKILFLGYKDSMPNIHYNTSSSSSQFILPNSVNFLLVSGEKITKALEGYQNDIYVVMDVNNKCLGKIIHKEGTHNLYSLLTIKNQLVDAKLGELSDYDVGVIGCSSNNYSNSFSVQKEIINVNSNLSSNINILKNNSFVKVFIYKVELSDKEKDNIYRSIKLSDYVLPPQFKTTKYLVSELVPGAYFNKTSILDTINNISKSSEIKQITDVQISKASVLFSNDFFEIQDNIGNCYGTFIISNNTIYISDITSLPASTIANYKTGPGTCDLQQYSGQYGKSIPINAKLINDTGLSVNIDKIIKD